MTTTKKAKSRKKAAPPASPRGTTRKSATTAKKTAPVRKKAPPRPKATAKKRGASTGAKMRHSAATKEVANKKRTATVGTKATTAASAKKRVVAISRKKAGTTAPTTMPGRRLRRAIYIDVENTSSKAALLSVIDSLKIDHQKQSVELSAVGNWRAVGQQVGRELAGLGAQLVHSAPTPGVRDWSDLWIAVAAGGWIARAQPGDILEIVSNDRAFDAVGDAAAAQGVIYERVPHRRSAAAAVVEKTDGATPAQRPRTGRRRRSRRTTKAAATTTATTATTSSKDDPHGASRDQMIELVSQLSGGRSSPWVNLDVLEDALKRQGFARPANSPRLVTRLRRLKDFEVDAHGRVRIIPAGEEREIASD